MGFIGHFLIDVTSYGPWWSWIVASALAGLIMGVLMLKDRVQEDGISRSGLIRFNVAVLIGRRGVVPGRAGVGHPLLLRACFQGVRRAQSQVFRTSNHRNHRHTDRDCLRRPRCGIATRKEWVKRD